VDVLRDPLLLICTVIDMILLAALLGGFEILPVWPFKRPSPPPPVPVPSCVIDFHLSDESRTIVQMLKRTIPFLEKPTAEFDLTRIEYLGPFAAAILLANHLKAKQEGRTAIVRFPTNRRKVEAFLRFSGLDHHLRNGLLPDRNHPENVTVPLTIVQKATFNAADPIIELVHKHAVISDDDEVYLRNSVNEVIQNVEDHAQSSFGAVYCARYLATPKKIRVGIVDCGLGIGTTLARRHPEIENAEAALKRVVRGGISAQSRPNNMGVGISNLWGHITNPLRGEIFIVTEDVIGFSDRAGNLRTLPLGARFAGTGVFFTVPVDRLGV
jgi:hypothetical protein